MNIDLLIEEVNDKLNLVWERAHIPEWAKDAKVAIASFLTTAVRRAYLKGLEDIEKAQPRRMLEVIVPQDVGTEKLQWKRGYNEAICKILGEIQALKEQAGQYGGKV